MLVHICCSVDSHYFLQKLRKDYKDERIEAFFYDPNIHPYSEYMLRYNDVERSCDMLDIPLHLGDYDVESWFKAVKGFENEPEKGERCSICFDYRFDNTAKKAKELSHDSFTSTLLMSPKKSLQQLSDSGQLSADKFDLNFVSIDYRQGGGTNDQSLLAKKDKLFKQDYCGCVFALNKQRAGQKKLAYELLSPINKQIQPSSIEEKINLYEKRRELEKQDIEYMIIKESIQNYRLLNAKIISNGEVIPSYILAYSLLKRGKTQGKIEFSNQNIHFFNRENIRFIDIEVFNQLMNASYKNTKELNQKPPIFQDEINLRNKITSSSYSTSPIIIVDKVKKDKYKIVLHSEVFSDNREELVVIS